MKKVVQMIKKNKYKKYLENFINFILKEMDKKHLNNNTNYLRKIIINQK